MKNNFSKIIIVVTIFFALLVGETHSQNVTWKTVNYIIDGDTFVTKDGSRVRLLGINTPEIKRAGKKSQFYADEAKQKLTKLLFHKKVRLEFGDRYKDRYGRLLAHIYKEDGTWINAKLIEQGFAHVYSFPDNRMHTNELIKIEGIARNKRLGIWSNPRWKVYKTSSVIPDSAIGKFNIIEGTVNHVTKIKDKTFINFGADWRKDFTVEIHKKNYGIFKQSNIDITKDYTGKILQVRGIFKPVNGVLVTATHPEQLTFLANF